MRHLTIAQHLQTLITVCDFVFRLHTEFANLTVEKRYVADNVVIASADNVIG